MKSKKVVGAVLLSLAASIWGGMFVVVKVVVTEIPPIELVWCRYLVAMACLLVFAVATNMSWHFYREDVGTILLIGVIGNTLSIVAQETGTWLSSAQLGAVITSATPTFMIIFAWWLLHERIGWGKGVSVACATLGVVLIVGIHLAGKQALLGVLCLIFAALTWALMSVLVKKIATHYSALQTTIMATAIALICLTPWVMGHFSTLQQVAWLTPKVSLSLLYLGAISTATAFVMWNKGLAMLNAASSGLYFLLQPLVGTLLSWWLLGENVAWSFAIGAGLIIVSVWLSVRFPE